MEKEAIEAIIRRARVCRLGLIDGDTPYIVPMCFGYREGVLYFHTSPKSRKLELIRRQPRVCFEMDILTESVPAAAPCDWNMRYRSVIGFGTAALIEDRQAKRTALGIIMDQYTDGPPVFPAADIDATAVIRVSVDRMTGKQSGTDR